MFPPDMFRVHLICVSWRIAGGEIIAFMWPMCLGRLCELNQDLSFDFSPHLSRRSCWHPASPVTHTSGKTPIMRLTTNLLEDLAWRQHCIFFFQASGWMAGRVSHTPERDSISARSTGARQKPLTDHPHPGLERRRKSGTDAASPTQERRARDRNLSHPRNLRSRCNTSSTPPTSPSTAPPSSSPTWPRRTKSPGQRPGGDPRDRVADYHWVSAVTRARTSSSPLCRRRSRTLPMAFSGNCTGRGSPRRAGYRLSMGLLPWLWGEWPRGGHREVEPEPSGRCRM